MDKPQGYTLEQAAERVGVHYNTIALWATEFRDKTSDGAKAAAKHRRRYSDSDVQLFRLVNSKRKRDKLNIPAIKEFLAPLTVEEIQAMAADVVGGVPAVLPPGADIAGRVAIALRSELESIVVHHMAQLPAAPTADDLADAVAERLRAEVVHTAARAQRQGFIAGAVAGGAAAVAAIGAAWAWFRGQ